MSDGSVDILVQRAEVLLSRNISQAIALLDDALAIAKRTGYKKGIARIHYAYALSHLRQNSYKKSLTSFNDALQTFEELDDKQSCIKCLNEISAVYFKLGDSPSALEYTFKSLRLYTEVN